VLAVFVLKFHVGVTCVICTERSFYVHSMAHDTDGPVNTDRVSVDLPVISIDFSVVSVFSEAKKVVA
jgi:hypothetical protein